MKYLGRWVVKKTMYPTEEGIKHLTKEELIAAGADSDDLRMFDSVIVINDNGTIETFVQVPADCVEEAKAQGAPVDENGCILVETSTWREENGEYLYEISGETVPFTLTEDGLLEYAMGMMLLEKIG